MKQAYILVINCGSSSLKFALYQENSDSHMLLCEGLAESLNQEQGKLSIKTDSSKDTYTLSLVGQQAHAVALEQILLVLEESHNLSSQLKGIGHRVVHGGKLFSESVLINDQVINQIKSCIPLAPLHNPANLTGIELLRSHFNSVPQVAVFDTSFHQTLPAKAYLYALPYKFYEQHDVRKYGFHGTSHRCIAQLCAKQLNKHEQETSLISAHLGNGASVCSISSGKSVDTSMGMTPLEGLVMGTRSGDLDPGIFDYMVALGHSVDEVSNILNKQSGLLGVSTISNDMRTICDKAAEGHELSTAALELFCFRAAKHIAGMMISLNKLDALVFTGGIGENASIVRAKICEHLSVFNFKIDLVKNDQGLKASSPDKPGVNIEADGSLPILVIPTDEEGMIVNDTIQLIASDDRIN